MTKSKSSKPYDERTDHEKLHSSWKKARAQFKRKDWSASVTRVATAAEIATNIYVRGYLVDEYHLPWGFVDNLLKDTSGIFGKFLRLVQPIARQRETWTNIKKIQEKHIQLLNDHRNEVVHSGRFKNRGKAVEAFTHGLAVINTLTPFEAKGLEVPK
ncbi:hypothetical protein [Acidithiobacillus ferriphilus]|uniref:hypothetical protein n=1 Tax=Acidithiobacillus ferriphilus TaxID=1689834 RepID=UPI001C067279|nr:hypothetical protein [Acidithiobacillus ferriphilus]MBU2827847.1 hypothetical protein [Acidithiobacillus ferriphilus]MBU2846482.1 hypothetical protein [Acidithiobacillus ferriphilus]